MSVFYALPSLVSTTPLCGNSFWDYPQRF